MDPVAVLRLMIRARALEERLIAMTRSEDGHFWIGGTGEEALNVPLGLQVRRGQGLDYDFLHLHYRSGAIMMAMGQEMIGPIRQMACRTTDPFSGGRNFTHHYVKKAWNVVPVTSVIEVQHPIALGTAIAQRRHGGQGITIVNGGDAGSAEGDFASALVWASRPDQELPMLILVANNRWGISTPYSQVHGDAEIARRADAFGIRWAVIDGNDPEVSWRTIAGAMAYIRTERRPFVLEARVSRLNGHSSSSGAARIPELDCVEAYSEKLIAQGSLTAEEVGAMQAEAEAEAKAARDQAVTEPVPHPDTIHDHTYA